MAEENKVEETTEATEAAAEGGAEKKESKKKKDKPSVDVNALVGKAKDGINQGSDKISNVVKEADDKKKMLIFLAIIALEVVLSVMGGVNPLCLVVQVIVAIVGYIALKAAFPSGDSKEEEKEEE